MSHALALTAADRRIDAETPADAAGVAALVAAAFGPGRFAKTAERLREGSNWRVGFGVRDEAAVIGSVRLWPIRVGETPALFLGPIAVDATRRSGGLGAELVEACLEGARTLDVGGVLLVVHFLLIVKGYVLDRQFASDDHFDATASASL